MVKHHFGQKLLWSNIALVKHRFGQTSLQSNIALVKHRFGQLSLQSNITTQMYGHKVTLITKLYLGGY
jgi:hypothetical protein